MTLDNATFATGSANPLNLDADVRRFCEPWVPDFTAYGNQPKVHAIATEVRSTLWLMRVKKKQRMRRSAEANGLGRVSGRISAVKDEASFCASPVRKAVRSWCSLAPKSPADHWLQRHGYQQCPF